MSEKTLKPNLFTKAYLKQANERLQDKYFEEQVRLIKDYVPIATKMAYVKNIVDATCFDKTTDKEGNMVSGNKFMQDTSMQFILYIMTLIDIYTNIKIEYGNNEYPLTSQYDDLKSAGLIERIIHIIPESEEKEFKTLLKMKYDDTYTNYATPEALVNRIVEAISAMGQSFSSILSDLDEDKINMIVSQINQLTQ